jgi:hypothetical protein
MQTRKQTTARATGFSVLSSLFPLALFTVGNFTEREVLGVPLCLGGLVMAVFMAPIAVWLTARSFGVTKPAHSAPWLTATLGPLLVGIVCLLLLGQQRRLRLWYQPDFVDFVIDVLFVAGSATVLSAVAWRRTGRWDALAVAWVIIGALIWAAIRSTDPHTDVVGDNVVQMTLLFPAWTLTLAPPFSLWVFGVTKNAMERR